MRRMLRPGPLLALLAALAAACGDPPAAPAGVAAPAGEAAPSSVIIPTVPQVFLDLVEHANRAHVRRLGPVLSPDAPGWARVTQLADRGSWGDLESFDDRTAAWLDGIGGTVWFPVGEEGHHLRHLSLWLKPITRGQHVTIFVDEQEVTTMRVPDAGGTVHLKLPMERLEPGEHSVRFWFRFTRYRGKKRTPAAISRIHLLPAGEPPSLPAQWVEEVEIAGARGRALLAGPPAAWSWYLLPPVGGRLFARVAVADGGAVDFIVRIDEDGQPSREVRRFTVQPGTSAELDVDLSTFAWRPLRLSLETEGDPATLGRAAWIEPTILMPGRPRSDLPPVRNVVVWSIDGLRGDRVGLGRGGDHAATPNLDLLAAEGGASADVWSGGATAAEGHRQLLRPHPDLPSLVQQMAASDRRTGLIAASDSVPADLAGQFNTRDELGSAGSPAETPLVLRELNGWLDARKRESFFLYVVTADPRLPQTPGPGYERLYQHARPVRAGPEPRTVRRDQRDRMAAYDARVSAADYWVGQLLALLHRHGLAEDTAVVVTGSVGELIDDRAGAADAFGLVPALLQVPLVVWHPQLRDAPRPRPLVQGGQLADVGATVLALAGLRAPERWPGIEMTSALFHGLPLPPHPSHARQGNLVAARFGDWLLRGVGGRDLRLWNLAEDPAAREEIGAGRPIALRALRDSMLDRP